MGVAVLDPITWSSGHPARKNTRLWLCQSVYTTPGAFIERLNPRVCCTDSAAGECQYKRQHGIHQRFATGGKGSQRGLQGSQRHKVPPMLVDEILAALFPENLPLEQLLEPIRRRQFSDEEIEEIRRALASPQHSTPAPAVVCPATNEGRDGGTVVSDMVAAHGNDTDVI